MVIVVINNKGGTGKTTTSVNLSAAMAGLGRKVLLVDLDSQASASMSLGIEWGDLSPSIADVLFDDVATETAIRSTKIPHLDLLTGGMELAHSDLILADAPGRENKLAESLKEIKEDYDFIFCDCPPSLSMIPVNAMVAADAYMVPVTAEYLALEGLVSLMDAMSKLKEGMDIDVKLLGIVLTMVPCGITFLNPDKKAAQEVIDLARGHYKKDIFATEIKRDTKLAEAPSFGKSIFEYASSSRGAKQYGLLAKEVVERCSGVEEVGR